MNPNTLVIPDAAPAPANVVTQPHGVEPLPYNNQIQPENELQDDIAEADRLMASLKANIQQINNWTRHDQAGTIGDPAVHAAAGARFQNEQADIENALRDLALRSNTALIVDRLARRHEASQIYENGIATPGDKLQAAVRDSRHTANTSRNRHIATSFDHAANPLGALPSDATQQERRDRDAELKARATQLSTGSYDAARGVINLANAANAHNNFLAGRGQETGLDVAIERIVTSVQRGHEASITRVEAEVTQATDLLRQWDFQAVPSNPGLQQDVRDSLGRIQADLNNPSLFSPYDAERARLAASYTRLRYRLEQRCINFNAPGNPGPYMESDGGIVIHEGDPEEITIYANGDTWAPGDVRRNAFGHEVTTEDLLAQQPELEDERVPSIPALAAFARWEESRNPDNAEEAYAAINQSISSLESNENALNAHADQLRETMTILHTREAELIAKPKLTSQETTELRTVQQSLTRTRRDSMRVVDQRRQLREELNPLVYGRSLIESSSNRPEPQPQRKRRLLGLFALGKTVESELHSNPAVQQDGSLIVNNLRMNGRRGTWRIYADGRAGQLLYDETTATYYTQYHDTNGARI